MKYGFEDDPEWIEWVRHVETDLIPKLDASALAIHLVPGEEGTDVKFAVELGFSIMMDKPIIAVVRPGTKVPEKLIRVADRIVEANVATPVGQARIRQAISELLE